ncbi:MAG: GntR family transcriptional regulator [Cyclobacteriaceae bacterium]|nr:GntR family transcriptional regulator [Cyclobacteriaceae bacterium]
MNEAIPRHQAIYETIRKNIEDNTYPGDSLLPSENEMCARLEVTRPTARQALTRLENDGFIKRHQGKGSIVQKVHHRLGILSIKGVSQRLGAQGSLTTKIIKKPVVEPWPDDFMFELTPEERSLGCINMKRLRLIDDKPIIFDIVHLVNIDIPRFCQKKYEKRSLFSTLKNDYGIEVVNGEQNIRAINATKELAKHLQVVEKQAILHLEGAHYTSKNLRIFSEAFCSSDRFYLHGSF